MPKQTIEFDRQEVINLKRAYTMALKSNKEVFQFQGKQILTAYAKYLIEYLEGRFDIKKTN